MDSALTGNAFAVPPRLHSRKRKAPVDAATGDSSAASSSAAAASSLSLHFFTEAGYARFSAYGEAVESKLYWDEEQRRATCLTASSQSNATAKESLDAKALVDGGSAHTNVSGTAASGAKPSALKPPPVLLATTASAAAVAASTRAVATHVSARKHLAQILLEKSVNAKLRVRAENTYRRLSALTIPQHELYMHLLQKRIHGQRCGLPAILALTADEVAQWQALEPSVKEEQASFRHDLESIAKSDAAAAIANAPAFAATWYEKMMAQCRNDVVRMYPQHFSPSLRIAHDSHVVDGEVTVMKHVREVYSYGSCMTIEEARFVDGMKIDSGDDGDGADGHAFLLRHAISADLHAEKLMEQFDCDIAMSSSTLLALFDIEKQKTSALHKWIIPIKSRVFVKEKGAAKKHVYFDKPLPTESVGAREKMSNAGRARIFSAFQTESKDSSAAQTPQDPNRVTRGKVAYHVWDLGGRRILVRCTVHAQLTPAAGGTKSGGVPDKTLPVSVFVKPDYKYLGVEEQITSSEKRRFWLHSWLRGSSVLMVGRLNPQSSTVESWEKHTLASLVYGHDAHHTPEWFEPTESFQFVDAIFAATCNVPAGNYLLKSPSAGSSGEVELLMAAPGGGEDGRSDTVLDLLQLIGSERTSSDAYEYVLPKWTYVPGRIPYSYRTGMYCSPFFLDGVCPRIAAGESCDALHLRASRSSSLYWQFEDYTRILKTLKRADAEVPPGNGKLRPRWIKPSFPFCHHARSLDVSNPHAPVRCPKSNGECLLPHLTVHEVAERIADMTLHEERSKRRRSKHMNRQQRRPPTGANPAR